VKLKELLAEIPYVKDVEISGKTSHDVVIDYEEHENMPMHILEVLQSTGFHPDAVSD